MFNSVSPWPLPCVVRLMELHAVQPKLSYSAIAAEIGAMPEAQAHGITPTKSAISGKLWRWKRRCGHVARTPRVPRQKPTDSAQLGL